MNSTLMDFPGLQQPAKSHDCDDVLNPNFCPNIDLVSKEFFDQKQVLLFSVFNKCLLHDNGKTIVRTYLHTMDAKSVWHEFQQHMLLSSKGAAEKQHLHKNVCTTILDQTWKGSTEQFVLHFHEKFHQLDEVSPIAEHLPHSTRLTLLQHTVSGIPALSTVETLE